MSGLGQRFLFSTILLGGAILVLWLDRALGSSIGFLALALGFAALAWLEYLQLVAIVDAGFRLGGLTYLLLGLVGEWLLGQGEGGESVEPFYLAALAMGFPAGMLLWSFHAPPDRERVRELGVAALGMCYLLYPIICCLWLRRLGLDWALLLILLVKGNDIGAYLVGRSLGRTPLSSISPKKTWEGSIGGLLFGILVVLGFAAWDRSPPFGAAYGMLVAVVVGTAGQVGDLAESYLKRSYAVKDSGALVPAFGGALDILDSLLFAAPVLYFMSLGRTG